MLTIKKLEIVKFAHRNGADFFDELRHKIESYFTDNNIDKHANAKMKWKTVAMLSIYLVPYLIMVSGNLVGHTGLFFIAWLIMGLGMVGLGTSVMHDSNHHSYSTNKFINNMYGKIIILLGGYDVTWRLQHNILHHTYTNIQGLDDDIESGGLMRFSPKQERKPMHRYQHIYAWFLYGLMTLMWATTKDYKGLISYQKRDILKKERISLRKAIIQVTIYKIFYYIFILVLPIMFSGFAWYTILGGFVAMHFLAGVSLAAIFQLAHAMEEAEFPAPSDDRKMENNWAVHQLLNTVNFAPRNKPLSWFIGGLNYQIEHHLFPHICHVHYPKISKIVNEIANKYGVPYFVQPTFTSALASHTNLLKRLGRS